MAVALELEAPDKSIDYQARYRTRVMYIKLIEDLFERFDLDAITQPFTANPPPRLDAKRERAPEGQWWVPRPGTNNLSSSLGLPAVVVPGGYTEGENLPISIQFIGKRFTDQKVVQIAYGYEQSTKNRKTPTSVPALPGEVFEY